MVKFPTATLAVLLMAIGLMAPAQAETVVSCENADNLSLVSGGKDCFAIFTYGAGEPMTNGTLLVYLHGDLSSGGPGDSFRELAESMARPGRRVTVVLVRQGYPDSTGRQSSGSHFGRSDNATEQNIDGIGEALAKLKALHNAARLVVIGHSRGSNVAGVLLGRRPGLINAALLFSCPCDLATRESFKRDSRRGNSMGYRSLSPLESVGTMPQDTWVATITGSNDDNTVRAYLVTWYAALTRRGIAVRDVALEGEGHNWRSSWFRNAEVRSLLEEALAGPG
jgi:pimeloyl-ACP methyl ester carboxylesterase